MSCIEREHLFSNRAHALLDANKSVTAQSVLDFFKQLLRKDNSNLEVQLDQFLSAVLKHQIGVPDPCAASIKLAESNGGC